MRRALHFLAAVVGIGILAWTLTAGRQKPSHTREWVPEQAYLPVVRIDGDTVRVQRLRDFRHFADAPSTELWTDATYDLSRLERVWFALSPFAPRFRGVAHPFLSFEFGDSQFVAVSVEARKEVGESYSPLRGLLRTYETMVVLGTEQDLLGLRAVAWDDPIFVYPVAASRAQTRELFLALLERSQQIERDPEFYNTVTNNCTTNILDPVNRMARRKVGPIVGMLPGYSLEAAFDRGWIDTSLAIDEARAAHLMNERIRTAIDSADFSYRIRAHLAPGS